MDLSALKPFDEMHKGDEDLGVFFQKLGKTIAIDFDGVLHPYTEGWLGSTPTDEPPSEGAESFLQWCNDKGYTVIVFSTRVDHVEGKRGIYSWLTDQGLAGYISEVTHVKPAAVAYVDDRAVPYFGDWQDVIARVEALANGEIYGAANAQVMLPENVVEEDSPSIIRARKELEFVGNDDDFNEAIINSIKAFMKYGHSGGSASVAIPILNDLLLGKNLTPLTNGLDEWMQVSDRQGETPATWQSCRNAEAFSYDAGMTYYLLSESKETEVGKGPIHVSENKKA